MKNHPVVPIAIFICYIASSVMTAGATTPATGGVVSGTITTINNGPGDQTDPHVSGDLAAYTDGTGATTIRYYRFSTAVDAAIPSPVGASDSLSDVSGNKIAFTRLQRACSSIMVFDAILATTLEIAPTACPQRFGAAIGNTTVAFVDFATGSGVMFAADLSGSPAMQLSSATGNAQNPQVSPSGNVVVWEQCIASLLSCDVMKSVRAGTTWGPPTLIAGLSSNPDSDDTNVAYDSDRAGSATGVDIYFQAASGGAETQLQLPGRQMNPSISSGVIAFESIESAITPADIFVYVIATNMLYQVTNTPTVNETLNGVSVLPNGEVRVVFAANDGALGDYNVYARTFTIAGGDFAFDAIPPMSIAAGSSASTNVSVNSVNGFNSTVNLGVTGQPAGVTASLAPNSVTPSGGNSASSVLNVTLPSFLAPSPFTLTVTGTSGPLAHSMIANINVTVTPSSTSSFVGDLLAAGCIDNAGIANALTSKLSAAQSAGNVQTAINTLTALKNQIQAQASKHIHTACSLAGVAVNPVTALLLDVQGLIDALRISVIPDPITGYVVDSNGVGLPGATVSIVNSSGNTVAVATTDITGFYFLATTGVLTPGANYAATITGLAGFAGSTPASQAFLWQGTAIALSNFALN